MTIPSFEGFSVQEFFETGKIPKDAGLHSVRKIVTRKLDRLHYAHILNDLKSPPGNKLEALKGGEIKGLHRIRVNNQWKIVFEWTAQGPAKVRVVDYHSYA